MKARRIEERLETPLDAPTWLPAPLVYRMARYRWPGNVRELMQAVVRLVSHNLRSDEAELDPDTERSIRHDSVLAEGPATANDKPGSSRPFNRQEVDAALEAAQFSVNKAAQLLGVAPNTLRGQLDRLGIRLVADYRPEELWQAYRVHDRDLVAAARKLGVSPRSLRTALNKLDPAATPDEAS